MSKYQKACDQKCAIYEECGQWPYLGGRDSAHVGLNYESLGVYCTCNICLDDCVRYGTSLLERGLFSLSQKGVKF